METAAQMLEDIGVLKEAEVCRKEQEGIREQLRAAGEANDSPVV